VYICQCLPLRCLSTSAFLAITTSLSYSVDYLKCLGPGGKMEASDDSIFHAAVRETREEVGISATDLKHRFFTDFLADLIVKLQSLTV
jgi:hypothetical protein